MKPTNVVRYGALTRERRMAEFANARYPQPKLPDYDPLENLRSAFLLRLVKDAATLSEEQIALSGGIEVPATLGRIKHLAHGLSGAAGIYGFVEVGDAAADLEDAVIAVIAVGGPGEGIVEALGSLILHIARCCNS